MQMHTSILRQFPRPPSPLSPSFAPGKSPLENLIRPREGEQKRKRKGGEREEDSTPPHALFLAMLRCYHQGRRAKQCTLLFLLPFLLPVSILDALVFPSPLLLVLLLSYLVPACSRLLRREGCAKKNGGAEDSPSSSSFSGKRRQGRDCASSAPRWKIIKVCSDPVRLRLRRSKRSQEGKGGKGGGGEEGGEVCSSRHSGAESVFYHHSKALLFLLSSSLLLPPLLLLLLLSLFFLNQVFADGEGGGRRGGKRKEGEKLDLTATTLSPPLPSRPSLSQKLCAGQRRERERDSLRKRNSINFSPFSL